MKDSGLGKIELKNETIQGLFFLGIGICLLIYSFYNHSKAQTEWIMSPYLFPVLIAVFLILLSINLFIEFYKNGKKLEIQNNIEPVKNRKKISREFYENKLLISLGIVLVYYFVMPWIGFIISTILFLISMFIILGEKRIGLIIILSLATTFILYGLFHQMLHVMLP